MNFAWLIIFGAAFFEVGWVIGLKHADSLLEWISTIVGIIISFYSLIKASQKLPIGTVYAVFVGLGTAGTVIADIVIFQAPVHIEQIVLIITLLIGVIGLKLINDIK